MPSSFESLIGIKILITMSLCDASYLSEPQARSRLGGYFFLDAKEEEWTGKTPNGPVLVESAIMRNVMSAASEAEIGALYHNSKEAVHLRQTVEFLGHPQPPTPIRTDNQVACGFANDTMKVKKSKAMDMRYYWIQDCSTQGQIRIYWAPGATNLGDYHTKHHPPAHHKESRTLFLHT